MGQHESRGGGKHAEGKDSKNVGRHEDDRTHKDTGHVGTHRATDESNEPTRD